ncbi:MAG TPA: HAD-IIIC family phosphatase [Gemmatimonadales bacterium]|nr:HAD-IIIC family phosphatase [Gemmatimonadales bacterium]
MRGTERTSGGLAAAAASWDELVAANRAADATALSPVSIRRLAREARRLAPADQVRIAYLGDITFDPLPEFVAGVGVASGFAAAGYVAPFKQYVQELMTPGAGLRTFDPHVIVLVLTLRELCPEVALRGSRLSADQLKQAAASVLDTVTACVERALAGSSASLLVGNFAPPSGHLLGLADQKREFGEAEFYAEVNLELARRLRREARVQILDLDQLTAYAGRAKVWDPRLYYLAKMPWRESFLPLLAEQIVRQSKVALGRLRKCLVLDLDNTLWGGIVGEAGPDGIKVGPGDPEGEAFFDFQSRVRALKDRGIILALCSKNNPADVQEAFARRTEMPLTLDDFAAMEIGWEMKHLGLERIAQRLNIGLDSLVFCDDNPAECELVRQMLPQVEVLELPKDPAQFPALLDRVHGFDRLVLSDEDLERARQYRENAQRGEARGAFTDLGAYLASLGTTMSVGRATPAELSRAHQLFAKTNQFNTTTRRYSLAEVERFLSDPRGALYTVRVSDRFGDLGLVGLCLVRAAEHGWVSIDSVVLSCRAMGRGVEHAMLNHVKQRHVAEGGAAGLTARFIPTKKNAPAAGYFESEGFRVTERAADGMTDYVLDTASCRPTPCDWIQVTDRDRTD